MALILAGRKVWAGNRDAEGHRTYRIVHRVRDTNINSGNGPANVMQTPGLPLPGSLWVVGSDVDVYAWCRFDLDVRPMVDLERCKEWEVEQTFSTKPPESTWRACRDYQFEDPLLEPVKVSGSTRQEKEEGTEDRFGVSIVNSAWERIRGPQNEWDVSYDQIQIEGNVASLNLPLLSMLRNRVNQFKMWGLPKRTIKFSNYTWERKFWGACYRYYTLRLEFDIKLKGWDRYLLDEGTKALKGHWGVNAEEGEATWVLEAIDGDSPSFANPAHFIRLTDSKGNPMKILLDGLGKPAKNRGFTITDISPVGPNAGLVEVTVAATLPASIVAGSTVTIVGANPPYYDDEYTVFDVTDSNSFTVENLFDDAQQGTVGTAVFKGLDPGKIHVEYYKEDDLLFKLGLPTSF